jgi:hypothetical protein
MLVMQHGGAVVLVSYHHGYLSAQSDKSVSLKSHGSRLERVTRSCRDRPVVELSKG